MKLGIVLGFILAAGQYSFASATRPSEKIGQTDPPLYPYVCQGDPQSKVDWKGMVWGITNTVIGMIEPLGPIAALSSIIQSIDGAWKGGSDYDHASDCVKKMIDDAIDSNEVGEAKDVASDISDNMGYLGTLLDKVGDTMTDAQLNDAKLYYNRINILKDRMGSYYAPPEDNSYTKREESMLYLYTSALSIQATAAITIMAYIHERVPDQDTVNTELDFFIKDIQGFLDKEYNAASPHGIQFILDHSAFKKSWPSQLDSSGKDDDCRYDTFLGQCFGDYSCWTIDKYRNGLQVGSCKCQCGSGYYSCTYSCDCPKTADPGIAYIHAEWQAMDDLITQGKTFIESVRRALDTLRP